MTARTRETPNYSNNRIAAQSKHAGIVLAGGRSSRLGTPKAWLPFGPELMLQRVVRRLGEAVRPVVVAARTGQELPTLPPWVHMVHDQQEDRGPMEGLKMAMQWLQGRAEFAFVSGCDAPLLEPRFVNRMLELAVGFDIAVPHVHGFDEPLAAVYRINTLSKIRQLLAAGSYSVASLFDCVATRRVAVEDLSEVDLRLQSLVNVNDLASYRSVLEQAVFPTFQDQRQDQTGQERKRM